MYIHALKGFPYPYFRAYLYVPLMYVKPLGSWQLTQRFPHLGARRVAASGAAQCFAQRAVDDVHAVSQENQILSNINEFFIYVCMYVCMSVCTQIHPCA